MISAGDNTTKKLSTEQQKTVDLMCGQSYSENPAFDEETKALISANQACHDKVETAILAEIADMSELQMGFFDTNLRVGRNIPGNECLINLGFNPAAMGIDDVNNYIDCVSSYVTDPIDYTGTGTEGQFTFPEMKLEFQGNKLFFLDYNGSVPDVENFIKVAAENARKASVYKVQSLPLPPNLQKFIDDNKGVAGGFFANEAERLFREALAHVPPGNRAEAAKDGGVAGDHVANDDLDDVIDLVDKAIDDYKGAEVDGDKKAMKEAKDGLGRTYVYKKPGAGPEFPVTFNKMPEDIVKLVFGKNADKVSPGVLTELRKLYVKTLDKFYDKGGNPKKEETVKKPFAEAVKGAGITDPKKSASKIRAIEVEDVILNKDKSAKEVKFGKAKNAEAPADLADLAETGPQKAALQMLFNDISKLADLPKAKDPDALTEKIVADLKKKGVPEMSAVGIAALYPKSVNKKTGEVKLGFVPQEAFDSWQKLLEEKEGEIIDPKVQDVPDNTVGKLAVGGMHAITRIYADAMKDKKAKWTKDEAAIGANNWVKKIEKEDNDWQTTTDRIVSGKYKGRDGDMFDVTDKTGETTSVPAGPAFSTGNSEDGMHTVAVTGAAEGGVVSADDPMFSGYASLDFVYEYYKAKTGGLKLDIGIDGGGMPGVLLNGEPRGEVNVGDSLSGDQALWARFNKMSLGYFYKWDKKEGMDGKFSFNGGLLSGRFKDGTGRAIDSLSGPISNYQPFTAGGSTMYGVDPSISLNNDIVTWSAMIILGSANSYFLYDKNEGAIDAKGGRAGATTKLSADWAGDNEKFDELGIDAEIGFQGAFAGVDANAFTVGTSFGLLHDNGFDTGIGGGFGLLDDGSEKNAYRVLLGAHVGYNHALKSNENVNFLFGTGLNWVRHWQDKRVDVDSDSTDVGDTGDCDTGYDCDSDTDVGDHGNGTVSSTGNLSDFLTAGNNLFEISPYIGFNFKVSEASTIDLNLKVPIWVMDNIQAPGVNEVNWGLILGFGVNYDTSKLMD